MLQHKIGKIRECLAPLQGMEDSQMETALLRSFLTLPKLAYVLRSCPSHYITQATRDFDALIREPLETIMGALFQSGVGSRPLSRAVMEGSTFEVPPYMHLRHLLLPPSLLRPL